MCSRSVVDGMLAGLVIGLPPVLNYGSQDIYDRIVPEVCSSSFSHVLLSHLIRPLLAKNTWLSPYLKPLLGATSVDCKRPLSEMVIIGLLLALRSMFLGFAIHHHTQ